MSTSELIASASLIVSFAIGLLGWVKLKKMTPLESSEKTASDVSAQSSIIRDLESALTRLKAELLSVKEELKEEIVRSRTDLLKASDERKAETALVREELAACKKEFGDAQVLWAATELKLRRMMDKPE